MASQAGEEAEEVGANTESPSDVESSGVALELEELTQGEEE